MLYSALFDNKQPYLFFLIIACMALPVFAYFVHRTYKRSGSVGIWGLFGAIVTFCLVFTILFLIPYSVGALPGMVIGIVSGAIGAAIGRAIGRSRIKQNPS